MRLIVACIISIVMFGCNSVKDNDTVKDSSYAFDYDFLKKHTHIVELESGDSRVLIAPAWQARVMTTSSQGATGQSFGWINYSLIESGELVDHINPFGGEERLWLGPEGGQFSLFFDPGETFEFENWQTPPLLDTEPFDIVEQTPSAAIFSKDSKIGNYAGTDFDINITRKIRILTSSEIMELLGTDTRNLDIVAYRSENILSNMGSETWDRKSGLLSVWMLGMFNPSSATTVFIPVKEGPDEKLGPSVNDNYFGEIAGDRLSIRDNMVLFKADGESRGKIGIPPLRTKGIMGSYDSINNTLTILLCKIPDGISEFVNSAWELQENPFSGDAYNSYNDGPLEDGSIMGPFYELETSSPALSLSPGESYNHLQTTIHLTGSEKNLNNICLSLFGIKVEDITIK